MTEFTFSKNLYSAICFLHFVRSPDNYEKALQLNKLKIRLRAFMRKTNQIRKRERNVTGWLTSLRRIIYNRKFNKRNFGRGGRGGGGR